MTIKIGIVEAGGMADYHITGFRQTGAKLVAIADQNNAKCDAFAAEQGIEKNFSSLTEMLNGAELDAVSIITPNKFHMPLALEALTAGKHVFCEKPPALSAAETGQMRNAAGKAGKHEMG